MKLLFFGFILFCFVLFTYFFIYYCYYYYCYYYYYYYYWRGAGVETKSAHFFRLKTLFSKPLHTIRVSNCNLKWTWIVFVISTRGLNYLRLPLDIYNKNHIANFFFLFGLSFTNIHKSQDCISLSPHYQIVHWLYKVSLNLWLIAWVKARAVIRTLSNIYIWAFGENN